MGCCSSSQSAHETNVEDIPLKKKEEIDARNTATRPASGTVVKNGKGSPQARDGEHSRSTTPRNSFIEPPQHKKNKRGKPTALNIPDNSRAMDPNALNITPQNSGSKEAERKKKHEEDLNKMAMFIPWEKPALGGSQKNPPKLGQRRSSKSGKKDGKKRKNSLHKKKKEEEEEREFIPGSGNEKILMASSASINPKFLAPLTFNNVKADKTTMSAIEKDRQRVKEEKAKLKEITSFIKSECGFDTKIAKLIKQYAELAPSTQKDKFKMALKEGNTDGTVTLPM